VDIVRKRSGSPETLPTRGRATMKRPVTSGSTLQNATMSQGDGGNGDLRRFAARCEPHETTMQPLLGMLRVCHDSYVAVGGVRTASSFSSRFVQICFSRPTRMSFGAM